MKTRCLFLILTLILILSGCKTKKINNALISPPQESGFQFKQVTSEDQQICGPMVINDKGKLQWFTGSMFDISADGESLVYVASSEPGKNEGDLYIRSTTGGRNNVQRTFGVLATGPVFSPDGNFICFSSTFSGQENANICLINANEGNAIQYLTQSQIGTSRAPVFASDGNLIFYSRGLPNTTYVKNTAYTIWHYSIWSIEKSTAITTQYMQGSSPDYVSGDKILFTKLNLMTSQGEIWMFDIKTGFETLILRNNTRGYSTPKISPDGSRLLCTGSSKGIKASDSNLDIYMINLDGTNFKQLTSHPATDASPCWSPDGKSVYFLSKRGNDTDSYHIWSFDILE